MPTLVVRTPEGLSLRHELAGAGSRLAAALIDLMVVLLVYLVLTVAILLIGSIEPSGVGSLIVGMLIGGSLLTIVAYNIVFHALWGGQSPGKRVLSIRVVASDGYAASTVQHVIRNLIWLIDLVPVPICIGVLVISLTEKRQRLGDLAAGTLVVHVANEKREDEPFPEETWSGLERRTLALSPGMISRLSAKDFDFIRGLLTRRGLNADVRQRLFVQAARHYAERLELGAFDDARVFMKELYLFLRESRRSKAI